MKYYNNKYFVFILGKRENLCYVLCFVSFFISFHPLTFISRSNNEVPEKENKELNTNELKIDDNTPKRVRNLVKFWDEFLLKNTKESSDSY